jgi:uncharacterized OB-fold protein
MKPAAYWRANKKWSQWIGRQGEVVAATRMQVAIPELAPWTPLSYALVDFADERHEFLVAGQDEVQAGDRVECVLRKLGQPDEKGVIAYGIKVRKVAE